MERRKILRSSKKPQEQSQSTEHPTHHPNRGYSIMPTTPRIQEIARQSMNEQKISDMPDTSSLPHTEPVKRRQKFEERYKRVTTYFENRLHQKVKSLYDSGDIKSVSAFLNEALESYLSSKYPSV